EHPCPHCKKQKERKVVPLHEYGDPFMPSSVIIICKYCKHAETFAMAPAEQAKKYAEEIMGEGFKKAPDGMEDILIKS
ncbi:MAG TPA: hypothetical protein VMZ91_00845, partial [Candidatus Paceibacterota bacterium]|nr:hypothetical protein [Candidatus Paceibacterota bacterium]